MCICDKWHPVELSLADWLQNMKLVKPEVTFDGILDLSELHLLAERNEASGDLRNLRLVRN